jgi:TolB-like protein/Flp pilus assembly protein TadD
MSLVAELKRRNVFRVGVAYAIVAWLLVEVASVVLPTFEAPEWVMKVFTFLLVLGFPIALIFAWAFELTPEGIKRETAVDPGESITKQTGRKLDFAIIGLLALAVVFMFVDNYVLESEPEQAEVVAERASEPKSVVREKSIAVLPFANISSDPENAYFTDGIHDEVLAQLSKIRELKVISRTSVMRYRGEDRPSSPEIAAALGIANILEGSVRLAGNRVRITAQLIEAESDAHLWTETYDRELTAANIFSIQTEIAKIVADALRATLSPEEQELLDTVPTENMAALKAYFRGKQRMEKRTSATLAEAVDDFNRAIELDPGFALAYVGLADSYQLQLEYSGLPPDEMLAKAQAATDRALALDDRLAEAYTSLGGIEDFRNDFEAAEVAYKRALELNANYVTAYHWYSLLLGGALGRRDEALKMAMRAGELDPQSPIILLNVGLGYAGVGRFDESLAWYRKAVEIDPDFAGGYELIGLHYWEAEGKLDETVRWFRKCVSLDPGNTENSAFLGWLFLDLGDFDRAEYWSERSIELGPESFFPNLAMELFYLYRGDLSTALEYGRRTLETEHYWAYRFSSFEPVRIHEMRTGRYLEARAAIEKIAPELLNEDFPKVESKNYRAAIDLALILSKTGEQQRADRLLESSLRYIQQIPRLGDYGSGYGIADVQIYALQGDKQKTLSALQRAIDEGWRNSWWYYLKYDPTLESLHDEPEFQAMIEEIEADMAAQLARVREMERNGEFEPIPEAPTGSH